ncbi:MAG: hypothetical protein KDC71_24470, partial [Acidobacteria bacterium]|nr:hypothetical protein [Acidobacteriota bacterium]
MNILTFAAHQAYLHLLGCLTEHRFYALLMPDQRRFLQNWDPRCRPLPQNFRLLERENLSSLLASQHFQLGIAHNLTDLQELIAWKLPVVMVFHASLSGRMVEENTAIDPDQMRVSVNQLCRHHGVTQIFVTELKRSDWQANGIVIEHGLNLADYGPYEGEKPFVLRVANHLAERGTLLRYDFHQAVTAGLPITLLGENPSLRIQPAASWTD